MPPLPHPLSTLRLMATLGATVLALLVAACATRTPPADVPQVPPPGPAATGPAAPPSAPGTFAPSPEAAPAVRPGQPPAASQASTARAYRVDAARHLYALNAERIYKGMLPPNIYSIGVLEVDIDRRGQVAATRWLRPPRRAEVTAEILRTVRAAAPYPVPNRMARVTYTDTWLWDQSGRFQLDTLTEGQR